MAIRNIRKNLAGMEDLLTGVGSEEQARGDSTYTMRKIDAPYAVNTQAEMTALDIATYTRARVYHSTTSYTSYIYDAVAISGVAPDVGAGYWVAAGSNSSLHMTEAEAVADKTLQLGDTRILTDRANADFTVVLASGVTPNGHNILQCTGDITLALVLRTGKTLHFQAYGGSTSNTAAVNTTIMQLMLTHSQTTAYEEPRIAIDGGQYNFQYIDLSNIDYVQFYTFGTVTITGTDSGTKDFVLGAENYDTFPAVGVTRGVKFTGGNWLIGAGGGTSYTYVARLEGFVSCEINNLLVSGECGPASGADRVSTYIQYSYINQFNNCSFAVPAAPGAGYYSYGLYLGNDNNNLNDFNTCRIVGILGSPAEPRTVCARINGNANSMTNCDVSGAYYGVNINGSRGGKYNLYLEGCTELVTTGPAGEPGTAFGNVFEGGLYEVLTNGTAFNLGTNGGSQNTTIIAPRVVGLSGGSNRTFIDQVSSGATYGLSVINPDLTNIDTDITGTYRGMLTSTASMGILQSHWLSFPATQVSSTDANTLDDYQEADYTPTFTFSTPGDLSVTYSTQVGAYTKVGRSVAYSFRIITSAFTHTTASGALHIAVPVSPRVLTSVRFSGSLSVGGVTKASYTNFNVIVDSGSSVALVQASGSGVAPSSVTASNMPTGGSVVLEGSITYESA